MNAIERIETERLLLTPLTAEDAYRLFAYRSDPSVTRFQSFDPRSVADAQRFIADASSPECAWTQLALRDRATGELVGDVGVRLTTDQPPQAEIGVTLAPAHRGRGLATEAALGVLGQLFGVVHAHRVFASVDPRNTASMALFERLGMRQEAHMRASVLCRGEWTDDVVFALLRSEWEAR